MLVHRAWAVRATDMPTRSAYDSPWMASAGWRILEAAFTFLQISRRGTRFAERLHTTLYGSMDWIRRCRTNLSLGLIFRPLASRTGVREKASPILWAVTTDMNGWRTRLCIVGTCSGLGVICG